MHGSRAAILVCAPSALFSTPLHVAIFDRGGGLIYDDVLNITWLQDAGFGGLRTWQGAVDWADSLVYQGYDDWRLPSMHVGGGLPTGSASPDVVRCDRVSESACRDNELGYMCYWNLTPSGDPAPTNVFTDLTGNQGLIQHIQLWYWSGTGFDPSLAWDFYVGTGAQGVDAKFSNHAAWAVRPGELRGRVAVDPIQPAEQVQGQWVFDGRVPRCLPAGAVCFFDPPVATGYNYEASDPLTNFLSVEIPNPYGDGLFDLYLFDDVLGAYVDSGTEFTSGQNLSFAALGFGDGVNRFGIRGIEPSANVDPHDPFGFVTGLSFNNAAPNFTMTPTAIQDSSAGVPTPASLPLVVIGLLALRRGRRAVAGIGRVAHRATAARDVQ